LDTASTRNADATRLAVLDAAETLFSERGFDGTSMRELAKAAGVSQPLIYYHFTSKNKLYAAVKEYVLQRYIAQHDDTQKPFAHPIDLGLQMERFYAFLLDNQTLLRLSTWAQLEGDHALWPGEAELMHALRQRVEVSQRHGILRNDVDAHNLVIMLIALTHYWAEHRTDYAGAFSTPETEANYLPQAIAVLARGASPEPSPT